MTSPNLVTRLAPSPTGALHLGNARTFLVNWLLARQRGWRILLRIEDIDGPRVKHGADQQLIDDLKWLGLDWDDGPIYQSARLPLYREAIEQLEQSRQAYACVCSRREVELAASAPHAEDGATIYPGTCRGKYQSAAQALSLTGRAAALRFQVPEGIVQFDDSFAGLQRFEVARMLGDFVIAKADGTPAYQLAAAVDDAEMNVTDVVRGDDLLDSTPRQILLYGALGNGERIPRFWHIPLVVGTDGKRLAKRHGDTRLAYYRQNGVRSDRILALLARWCGFDDSAPGPRASDLIQSFRLDALPRRPIVFTADDDAWLLSGKA